MSKKDPEEQRRKKKRAEQKRKARQVESMAYLGEKYKKDKFIPTWMHTEIGIYQTYVMSDRKLCDHIVSAALENLIRQMRAGALPPLPEGSDVHYEVGCEEDLLIENVRRCWRDCFATEWQPPKDDLIGVLRTILSSIQKVKTPGTQSQSYLKHIAGFLTKQLGVSVQRFSADYESLPTPDEDELVRIGRQWYAHDDQKARTDFFEQAAYLTKNGQASRVIEACHLLASEISDSESNTVKELLNLSHQARNSLMTAMG